MATEIKMPQLSDTMDSGKILSWNKQEGDSISRGDILAEVETDKANLEIESFHNGVLLKIVTPAESSAAVGQVIAYIGEAGESVPTNGSSAASANGKSAAAQLSSAATPHSSPAATPHSSPAATPQSSPASPVEAPSHPSNSSGYTNGSASEGHGSSSGRVKASPLAKKLAAEKGVDLSSLSGSGPEGRIVKRDVESARNIATQSHSQPATSHTTPVAEDRSAPQPSATPAQTAGEGSLVPFSKMRATIARRMQQSVTEAPHFYTTTSICMDNVMELRKVLKEKKGYEKASINHFIIKAAACGIAAEPRVNYAVRDESFIYQPAEINIGIITALDDGLLIPVIRQADRIPFKDLVFEARAAVERARAGRPNAQDLLGGTFSISNMGMFDVESFTAVINPGQGSILAVSSIQQQPIVDNGQIRVANMMKVTISVDHRIIDGIMAGNFLKAFKESLETPALLLI
ncbi:MAG: 2-oxo acid dehydrogenase subunit E2 [Bdellovibrionales bacterium]|nr:2-oxo acid dehydrogenase subunit E2 [Bdellovibrionales bacterium]